MTNRGAWHAHKSRARRTRANKKKFAFRFRRNNDLKWQEKIKEKQNKMNETAKQNGKYFHCYRMVKHRMNKWNLRMESLRMTNANARMKKRANLESWRKWFLVKWQKYINIFQLLIHQWNSALAWRWIWHWWRRRHQQNCKRRMKWWKSSSRQQQKITKNRVHSDNHLML